MRRCPQAQALVLALSLLGAGAASGASPAPDASKAVAKQGAESTLETLQKRLPRTRFVAATTSPIEGLVAVTLENGRTAFTDPQGRYLLMGVMIDLSTGRFLYGEGGATASVTKKGDEK